MAAHTTKFNGKFKDLIPYGFKFQKLYAANYRQYCLQDPISEWSENCFRVWQHHGGYIELNDLGYFSSLIFDVFHPYNLDLEKYLFKKRIGTDYYHFVINRKTEELEVYDFKKHNTMGLYFQQMDGIITEEECQALHIEMVETYREVLIDKDGFIVNTIQDMYKKGWIK